MFYTKRGSNAFGENFIHFCHVEQSHWAQWDPQFTEAPLIAWASYTNLKPNGLHWAAMALNLKESYEGPKIDSHCTPWAEPKAILMALANPPP